MQYVYQAGAMGYGDGYRWHRFFGFKFPRFPIVLKTVTINKVKGRPYAVMRIGKSVFNNMGLPNNGLDWLLRNIKLTQNMFVSIAGTDDDISHMVQILDNFKIGGIEYNFSCPNIKGYDNRIVPLSKHPVYLKLNCNMDPYKYDLTRVVGVRLNTIPCWLGGGSGRFAWERNYQFAKKYIKEGVKVTGASWTSIDDINRLVDIGCKEIGIGSVMLINPQLVLNLSK
jgi:hypothetical protein